MKVLVTGATRGIGRAIVDEIAPLCSELTILARHADSLLALAASLETSMPALRVHLLPVDLSDLAGTSAAMNAWSQEVAGLDVLVLNAGTFSEGSLTEIPISDFEESLRINLLSSVVLVQSTTPMLSRSEKGRIVLIGSTAAYEDYPIVPSYGVIKWGVRSYASNLRHELRPLGIGVTLLSPGGTLTDMWEGEELEPNRLLEPRDVARLLVDTLTLSHQAVVEEIIVRPILGDIHE